MYKPKVHSMKLYTNTKVYSMKLYTKTKEQKTNSRNINFVIAKSE
ncbi:hypothetical protein Pint_03898 [Pistacia integerrima]|uniref:Uncharacterized protein n=1 Tax=Pistacia integerrima TaxID=434235 RepID=A0ACC0Z3A1_9ROSI|nr:hypothetical protein Pint_03898 [Pistacia integerrima]